MKNRKGTGKLIFLSEKEKEYLEKKASQVNLNLSQYIKKVAIDGDIIIRDLKNIERVITEINRIGTNINQIAKKVNQNNTASNDDIENLKQELEDLKNKVVKELYKV